MNRGFVLQLVRVYLNHFMMSESTIQLRCKFEFLQVLCNYEHFIPLNLPTPRHKLLKGIYFDCPLVFVNVVTINLAVDELQLLSM